MPRSLLRAAVLALACLLPLAARASGDYPSQPIRLIVPYAPGGFVDITARAVSPGLSQALHGQVVVENRTGAGGALGVMVTAKAPPDGYTLVLSSGVYMGVAPLLYPSTAKFSPDDFEAIGLVSGTPVMLVMGPATKIATLKELVDYAKANPGKLTMGSAGNGTTNHLTGELFKMVAGLDYVHVPYKGSGEALNDLIGGHIDFVFDQIPASIGFVRAGSARALAVAAPRRASQLPDVPTFAELGYPEVEASTSLGLLAPRGTPAAVVQKLNAAINAALADKATREAIAHSGAEPLGGNPEEFRAMIAKDSERWAKVIRTAKIKLE